MPTEETQTIEQTETQETEGAKPESFEAFLEGQDEAVKELYNQHSEALLNTVRATRKERDDMQKQIKELAKKADEGSETQKALNELSEKLEEAERRADFLEDAPNAQCRNPRAAWLLAQAEGHFDKSGRPNWEAIKAEAPELFGTVIANANAGTGTRQDPPKTKDMNAFIRAAAGRS